MTTAPDPTGSLSIRRALHNGAGYSVIAAAHATTALIVRDLDNTASVGLDRAAARLLIEDIELVAGLRPTESAVPLATALAGAVRRNFELLVELDKLDPAAADRIAAGIAHHLRSWKPLAILAAQGAP